MSSPLEAKSEVTTGKHGDKGRYVTTDNGAQIFLTQDGKIGQTGKSIDGEMDWKPVGQPKPAAPNRPTSIPKQTRQNESGGIETDMEGRLPSQQSGGPDEGQPGEGGVANDESKPQYESPFVQSFADAIIANIRKFEREQQQPKPAAPNPQDHPHDVSKLPIPMRQSLLNWQAEISTLTNPVAWARHGARGNDPKGVMKAAFDQVDKTELNRVMGNLQKLIATGDQQGIDLRPFVRHNNLVPRELAPKLKPSDLFDPVQDHERYRADFPSLADNHPRAFKMQYAPTQHDVVIDRLIAAEMGITIEEYAARRAKNSPGQMSLFGDGMGGDTPLRTAATQQRFDWDESKVKRDAEGKFAEKAEAKATPAEEKKETDEERRKRLRDYWANVAKEQEEARKAEQEKKKDDEPEAKPEPPVEEPLTEEPKLEGDDEEPEVEVTEDDKKEIAKSSEDNAIAMAPGVSKNMIPRDVAYNAHRWSSFVPERRAEQRQSEFVNLMNSKYQEFSNAAKTDEQKDILFNEWPRFLRRSKDAYMAMLHADSRTASSMVTGGSNFPVERNRKRLETAHRRLEDFIEQIKKGTSAIRKKLDPSSGGIRIGDKSSGSALENKLASLQKLQEQMKAVNVAVRKVADSKATTREKAAFKSGYDQASAIKYVVDQTGVSEKTAREVLTPDYMGRLGFPDFSIKNNGANIRRVQQQVAAQSKFEEKAQKADAGEIETEFSFNGGMVHLDYDENRIRIKHDSKPDRDTIQKLKSRGWRWSPSNSAWQRQLTRDARSSAQDLLGIKIDQYRASVAEWVADQLIASELGLTVEQYAARKAKNSPGQLGLFGDGMGGDEPLRTASRQQKLDWDESKVKRDDEGKFATSTSGSAGAKTEVETNADVKNVSIGELREAMSSVRNAISDSSSYANESEKKRSTEYLKRVATELSLMTSSRANDRDIERHIGLLEEAEAKGWTGKKPEYAKKDWQKTASQFADGKPEIEKARASDGTGAKYVPRMVGKAFDDHKQKVESAINRGENVPEHVASEHGINTRLPTKESEWKSEDGAAMSMDKTFTFWKQGIPYSHTKSANKSNIEIASEHLKNIKQDSISVKFSHDGDRKLAKRYMEKLQKLAEASGFEVGEETIRTNQGYTNKGDSVVELKRKKIASETKAARDKPKFNFDQHVKIAADDISKLRKSDVYRLIETVPDTDTAKMVADMIGQKRPDLKDEAMSSLFDYLQDAPTPGRYSASVADRVADQLIAAELGLTVEQYAARKVKSQKGQQEFQWITVNADKGKGQPVMIDKKDGTILAGMGGKFDGQKIGEIGKGKDAKKEASRGKGDGGAKDKPLSEMTLAEKLKWQKENPGKGKIEMPKKAKPKTMVEVSGGSYEFVENNKDGTIKVRNEQGDTFNTEPGEEWKMADGSKSSADAPKGQSDKEKIADYLSKNPKATVGEISKATGIKGRKYGDTGDPMSYPLNKLLKEMNDSGEIESESSSMGSVSFSAKAKAPSPGSDNKDRDAAIAKGLSIVNATPHVLTPAQAEGQAANAWHRLNSEERQHFTGYKQFASEVGKAFAKRRRESGDKTPSPGSKETPAPQDQLKQVNSRMDEIASITNPLFQQEVELNRQLKKIGDDLLKVDWRTDESEIKAMHKQQLSIRKKIDNVAAKLRPLNKEHSELIQKGSELINAIRDQEKAQSSPKQSEPEPAPYEPPTIPGQQTSLFGGDDLNTGQKSLFNMARPSKADQRAAKRDMAPPPASLLEQIDDEEKKRLDSRKSLPGQRDMFRAQFEAAMIEQYRAPAPKKSKEEKSKRPKATIGNKGDRGRFITTENGDVVFIEGKMQSDGRVDTSQAVARKKREKAKHTDPDRFVPVNDEDHEIVNIVGDRKKDVAYFKQFVDEAHSLVGNRYKEDAHAMREVLAQFGYTGKKLSGFLSSLQRRRGDTSNIPGFDEMLDYAQKHHRQLLTARPGESVASGDEESMFYNRLKEGFPPPPKRSDPEVIEAARGMSGIDQTGLPSEWDGQETESEPDDEWDDVPFSASFAHAFIERYAATNRQIAT